MPSDPSSSDDKTTFTPAPGGEGGSRPASSRAGSSGLGWTAPSVEHLQAMLPQYEIVSMLGHGGMGAVYKGKQISLDRMVAIKILPPGLEDDDAKFTERFRNEARTMARMNHPGIVSVYDFGETAEGQFYFVMEYVDGTDVAKMIQSSVKLPPDHALAITAHVCDALGYAHANGVIHRDIKPANILINMQGQVKVADFGLAKQDDPSQTSGLTKTGMAMGTPDYVAPEALMLGINVDGRADLYAIGVMLYQMLTGDIPRGLFLMPSVKSSGEIDPRFDKIITRAMQTDREERYQKASEIRKDLDVILTAPRVRQDASKAVAAVPQGAVKNVPGQRSAAQKPMGKGPGQPGAKKEQPAPPANPKSQSPDSRSNSKTGLYIGIAAAVAVIGGAVFKFSGGKPTDTSGSNVEITDAKDRKSAAPSPAKAAPIKVAEPARPPVSKPTPPASTVTASSDGWIDGLAEYLAVPTNVASGAVRQEGTAWRYVGPSAVYMGSKLPEEARANVALRYTGRSDGASGIQIILRSQKTGGSDYRAILWGNGMTEINRYMDKQRTELAKYDAPSTFDPSASHVFEFRAQGDVLTHLVDGEIRGSVQDATFSNGSFSTVGGLIERIEYRALGSAPAAPVIATTSSDGWIDGLAEYLAVPGNVEKGILIQDAVGWRWKGPSGVSLGARFPQPKRHANAAVRLTFIHGGNSAVSIQMRGESKGRFYQAQIYPNGKAGIVRGGEPENTTLDAKSVPGYDPAKPHVMEFRAEGDRLTLAVDGEMQCSAVDAAYASGGISLVYGIYQKIEYRDLGGVQAAAAPPVKASETTKPPAPVAPPDPPPPDAPTDPKLIALLQNYTKAITNGHASASAADKPAFEAELTRLKNNTPLPDAAEDAKLPAELKRLRGILRTQLK